MNEEKRIAWFKEIYPVLNEVERKFERHINSIRTEQKKYIHPDLTGETFIKITPWRSEDEFLSYFDFSLNPLGKNKILEISQFPNEGTSQCEGVCIGISNKRTILVHAFSHDNMCHDGQHAELHVTLFL